MRLTTSIEGRRQHFVQVEKDPDDFLFLNVTLTIFWRLSRLDHVNEMWSHPHLHVAAFYGWVDVVEALLKLGSNPDTEDSKGCTALHAACTSVEEGSTEVVQVLLKHGADPNHQADVIGFAPMHYLIEASRNAAEPWDCIGKLEALLKGGADINAVDTYGRTPIHLASRIPWCNSVFDFLQTRGARLDLLTVMKRSILHYAAMYGDLDHISYLRTHGLTEPDPDGKDAYDQTPLDLMIWRANAKPEELWKHMKQPTEDVTKAFYSLIQEMRFHRWREGHGTSYQDGGSGWRQVETENHFNPGNHLVAPLSTQNSTRTQPPSIEQEMQVGEWCASSIGGHEGSFIAGRP
ncbi:uncharacterized protein FTJAE_10832 [Fusarium tjaetaba]|uniref:Ankyrin n=1 Tax=Fusarium tjaetaba TaxID=1567544 RepID=A0A8H5QXH2_9HYPO|nr:uncharacterized protein FTJAE_10832 [Fusarium tjaetaba]KAF5622709.1 hypothetical protein FTJAE_10832 [Fusarium tjaetaba]